TDRRALEDRAVIGLAAAKSLRGLRAEDELTDLDAGGGERGHLLVARSALLTRHELDCPDYVAPHHHREGEGRMDGRGAGRHDGLVVALALDVLLSRHHACLPRAAHHAPAGLGGDATRGMEETDDRSAAGVPRIARAHRAAFGVDRPVLRRRPAEV